MALLDEGLAVSRDLGTRPLMERIVSRQEILGAGILGPRTDLFSWSMGRMAVTGIRYGLGVTGDRRC
jgi:hypothetical protein